MIERQVDSLGRIVVPAEMRRSLNIVTGDKLVMTQKGRVIVMQPAKSYCIICGKVTDLVMVDDTAICCNCARKAAAHLWPKEKAAK